MLYHILEHYDDRLPEESAVLFCNTGKECPETLDFVRQCAAAWNAQSRPVDQVVDRPDA